MSNSQYYGGNLIPPVVLTSLATFTSAATTANVATGADANIRITCSGQALWIKLGTDDTVEAAAGATSNILCPPGHTDINTGTYTYLAYIEDASAAKGKICKF